MTVLTDLTGALLYFTLLLPVWEQRPIVRKDLVPGPYPLKVSADRVEFARKGFEYADDDLKQRMIQTLGQSQTTIAMDILIDFARKSDNAQLVATILGQLDRLPIDDPKLEAFVAEYLSHTSWEVRFWATDTYGRLANAETKKLLKVASSDQNPRVRGVAVAAINRQNKGILFAEFEAPRNDADPHVRQQAWQVSLAASDATMHQKQIMAAARSEDVTIRFAVASALGRAPKALGLLLASGFTADTHPSVRVATAEQLAYLVDDQSAKMLLGLCGDEDFEVRRAAVASLKSFPRENVVARLLKLLADKHPFVRQEAEDTLVAIHAKFPVGSSAVTAFKNPDFHARMHACNVLGRIGVARHAVAIASQLIEEKRPENLIACLNALAELGYPNPDQAIFDNAQHSDPQVREAAARAMGNISSPKINEALHVLVADKDYSVVSAAIVSMGHLRDPEFSGVLLKILKDTGMAARYSSTQRAEACWSLGRFPKLNNDIISRLLKQATTPVIPTPNGPVFEQDVVLVSASFALASQGRKDPAAKSAFGKVYAVHARSFTNKEMMNVSPKDLIPTAEVKEYASQAKAFMEGRDASPGLRPTRNMVFLYRSLDSAH